MNVVSPPKPAGVATRSTKSAQYFYRENLGVIIPGVRKFKTCGMKAGLPYGVLETTSDDEVRSLVEWNNKHNSVFRLSHADYCKVLSHAKDPKIPLSGILYNPLDGPADDGGSLVNLGVTKSVASNAKCVFVQLGRIGDILNILPAIKLFSSTNYHSKIPLIVHSSMVAVTGRVSYVGVIPYGGDINNVSDATRLAEQQKKEVRVAQLFSNSGLLPEISDAYNYDQYIRSGCKGLFGKASLELDARCYDFEEQWLNDLVTPKRPFVCVNFNGHSSPFLYKSQVMDSIKSAVPEHAIVDLDLHRTEYYTDQVVALDECDCLVTIDTATLHLANASHCPVMAFISDNNGNKWFGTKPIRSWNWSCRYSETLSKLEEFSETLKNICTTTKRISGDIVHVVSKRNVSDPRIQRAVDAWENLYRLGFVKPHHVWSTRRNARSILKDKRELPFLRDVLEDAMSAGWSNDAVLLFTNDDVTISPVALTHIRRTLSRTQLLTGSRMDHDGSSKSYRHVGRDMFACTFGWIRNNIWRIPDFVLGASEWDITVAALARSLCGRPTTLWNLWYHDPMCELAIGLLHHEIHSPQWQQKDNINAAPSQIYNRRLTEEWLRSNGSPLALPWARHL